MSANEKIDQPGLTIITRPAPAAREIRAHVLSTIEDVDSNYATTPTLTPTTTRLNGERDTSPLYLNSASNSATPSMDADRPSLSKQATVYESDVEACIYKNDIKIVKTQCDGKVWPGRRILKQRYKTDKRKHQGSCSPLKNYDKRTRIIIKVGLILLLVGGAIALGIGISKAVGGGIWKSSNSTRTINR